MKKLLSFSIALVILLTAVILCSCHGRTYMPEFEVPDDFDTEKEYTITFWAKNDSNQTQIDIYKNAVSEFEKLYPNIHVNLTTYTDYGDIYNDVITNISTKTTPNVCITYPDHIATYLTGDSVVVPLDTLIEDDKYGLGSDELKFDAPKKDEMVSEFLSECYQSGYYYSLPFMRSTEVCYVNKTYVEQLGFTLPETLTWDFMWEVAEKASERDENGLRFNGKKTMVPVIYKSTDNMLIQYLAQSEFDYTTSKGDVLLFNDDTKDFLLSIAENASKGYFSTFKLVSYPANFLNRGECIFAIDSTAGATWMGSDAPHIDISEDTIVDFETVVMAVPQADTENIKMISQGPSVCIFNKDDPGEVLASWIFVQYLLSNDVQIAYSETEGYLPVTTKALESEEYKDYLSRAGEDNDKYYKVKLDATKLLLDNLDNTFVTPVFNGSASVRNAAGALVEQVVTAIRRNITVDDAYIEETVYDSVKSLYKLDNTANPSGKYELGELPAASVVLIATLVSIWIVLGTIFIINAVKKAKKGKTS